MDCVFVINIISVSSKVVVDYGFVNRVFISVERDVVCGKENDCILFYSKKEEE